MFMKKIPASSLQRVSLLHIVTSPTINQQVMTLFDRINMQFKCITYLPNPHNLPLLQHRCTQCCHLTRHVHHKISQHNMFLCDMVQHYPQVIQLNEFCGQVIYPTNSFMCCLRSLYTAQHPTHNALGTLSTYMLVGLKLFLVELHPLYELYFRKHQLVHEVSMQSPSLKCTICSLSM